jgi:hypothetical protein
VRQDRKKLAVASDLGNVRFASKLISSLGNRWMASKKAGKTRPFAKRVFFYPHGPRVFCLS